MYVFNQSLNESLLNPVSCNLCDKTILIPVTLVESTPSSSSTASVAALPPINDGSISFDIVIFLPSTS
jgi:hypothetical protein